MAALLSRLGQFSARHRIIVLIAWVAAVVIAAVVALTGMRFSDGSFDVPGTDSSRAMQTLEDKFGSTESTPSLQLVIEKTNGSIVDDAAALAETLDAVADDPHVEAVSNPFDPQRPYVSPDLTTAVAEISFEELSEGEAESAAHDLGETAEKLRADGYTVEVGGSLTGGIPEILGPSEIVGAAIAFLVLMLTFGSLVTAGANMASALVGVGVGVLGVLAFSALSPIGTVTPILAVMLGLAVGIDYALFILSRFRTELRDGRDASEAIGRAVGTAGSSVVFAGATVVIALVGLTVVGIPFIGEMGLAAAFAVAVAVLASLTLLPALMGWLGRRVLGKAKRRRTESRPDESPAWARAWARGVTRRPWVATLGTVVVLAALALPLAGMQTTLSTPGGEDPESTQRAAYDLIAEKFGEGAQDPLVVLVGASGPVTDTAAAVAKEIEGTPNVAMVVPSGESDDGTTAMLTVFAETGPLDPATPAVVNDIRALSVNDATIAVTGGTAIGLDSDEQLRTALVLYVVLIVGLSLILLIVLFRSLLIPLVATLGFLLSLGAGLGATVAIFQWGWLDPLIQAPQGNPLISLLPIIVTGILFGLAMDYQVFLVSRMHEAHRHGMAPAEAVRDGFRKSGPVVLAAAAIMTAVFAGFALSPSSLVGSIAMALTVGVLADALLVRMILMPAVLTIMGRAAWWMPRWLDRALPSIDVEGEALTSRGNTAVSVL
jgi:RND superfamily putative drug exporter